MLDILQNALFELGLPQGQIKRLLLKLINIFKNEQDSFEKHQCK